MKPHEVVGRYAEIDSYVKRAPAEAAGWIYQQTTGQSPLELARQIAAQHSPQQHQAFYIERDVNTFFDLVPDAAKYQNQIVAALERGEIQRTGNIIADMKRVYHHVRKATKQEERTQKHGVRNGGNVESGESQMSDDIYGRNYAEASSVRCTGNRLHRRNVPDVSTGSTRQTSFAKVAERSTELTKYSDYSVSEEPNRVNRRSTATDRRS